MLKLIFIHIPKTAGSTIFELLKRNFDSHEIIKFNKHLFNVHPQKDRAEILLNVITSDTKVLHGHFTFQDLRLVIHNYPDAKIITFIRKPVDRVISNYKFFKKRILIGKAKKRQLFRVNESLMEYARRYNSRNRMSNILDGVKLSDLYFLGFFENIEPDIKSLFNRLNLKSESIPIINENRLVKNSDISVSRFQYALLYLLNYRDVVLYRRALRLKN